MQDDKYKYLYALKDLILKLLKALVKQRLFIILFGAVNPYGIWAWLAGKGLELVFEYIVVPSANWGMRRGLYYVEVFEGVSRIKRIRKAERDNNETDYDTNIGDV